MVSYTIFMGDKVDLEMANQKISSYLETHTLSDDLNIDVEYVEKFIPGSREDVLSFKHIYPRVKEITEERCDEQGNMQTIKHKRIVQDILDVVIFNYGEKAIFLIQDRSGVSKVRIRNILQKLIGGGYNINKTCICQPDLHKHISGCKNTSNPKYEASDVEYVEFTGSLTRRDPDGMIKKSSRYNQEDGDCIKIDCESLDGEKYTINLSNTVKITSRKDLFDIENLIRKYFLKIIYEKQVF